MTTHYKASVDKARGCAAAVEGDAWSYVFDVVDCNTCRIGLGLEAARPQTVLDEAARITSKDRQDQYGSPAESFAVIATLWNGYLMGRGLIGAGSVSITPRDVCMLMVLLKAARDANKPKRDNLVDIAGYARCCEMVGS